MSADHRKPVVAFVVLAFLAAALVGVQRADAQAGRFLAAALGSDLHAHGQVLGVPEATDRPAPTALPETLAPASQRTSGSSARAEAAPPASLVRASGDSGHGLAQPGDRVRAPRTSPANREPAARAAEQAHTAVSKSEKGPEPSRGRSDAMRHRDQESTRSHR